MTTTTRRQLHQFGASEYLVKKVTKALTPIKKERRAYVYDLVEVIGSIRYFLDHTKLRPNTCQKLEIIIFRLNEIISANLKNVVAVNFVKPENSYQVSNPDELLALYKQILELEADIDERSGRQQNA